MEKGHFGERGGQHYKPSVVGGGGVDFEIKIWQGGGVGDRLK